MLRSATTITSSARARVLAAVLAAAVTRVAQQQPVQQSQPLQVLSDGSGTVEDAFVRKPGSSSSSSSRVRQSDTRADIPANTSAG